MQRGDKVLPFADEETLSERRQTVQSYASQAVGGGDSKESQVSQLQSPGLQLCSTQKTKTPFKSIQNEQQRLCFMTFLALTTAILNAIFVGENRP